METSLQHEDAEKVFHLEGEEDRSSLDSQYGSTDEEKEGTISKGVDRLLSFLQKNEFHYDSYVELIMLLRIQNDQIRLRDIRQKMSKLFPLTEDLWLEWIHDEEDNASTEADWDLIISLLNRATEDYMSVKIWVGYVKYMIDEDVANTDEIRKVFERALTAVGLHFSKGIIIWDEYRQFEINVLNTIAGSESLQASAKEILEQKDRITALFKRELAVPLFGMQQTWREFESWMGTETIDDYVKEAYEQAVDKLEQRVPYEDALLSGESNLDKYLEYIEFEKSTGEPARIQSIYERAIRNHCLIPELWQSYLDYLDTKLKVRKVALTAYRRAVRNCPWSATLWHGYLRAQERADMPLNEMRDSVSAALTSNFANMEDDLYLWLIYIDRLRRIAINKNENSEDISLVRATFEAAINHMYNRFESAVSIDYLQKYWARFEAKHCKNLEKAQKIWEDLLSIGHNGEVSYWIDYIELEREYGDIQKCRKLFQRAIRAVNDDPERICTSWLAFERENGNLSDWDAADLKCQDQLQIVKRKRAKAAEKEAEEKKRKKEERERVKMQDTINRKLAQSVADRNESTKKSFAEDSRREKRKFDSSDDTSHYSVKKSRVEAIIPKPVKERERFDDKRSVFISNVAYSATEEDIRKFFVECGKVTGVRLVHTPSGKFKGFGYVEFEDQVATQKALQLDRNTIAGRPVFVSENIDKSKNPTAFKYALRCDELTVFVKNIAHVTSDRIREAFSQSGEIRDIRIVTRKSGQPRGFAYIEFHDKEGAANAVKTLDGTLLDGKTISVAISDPSDRKRGDSDDHENMPLPAKKKTEQGELESKVTGRGRGRTGISFMVPRSVKKSESNQSDSPEQSTGSKLSNEDFRKLLTK